MTIEGLRTGAIDLAGQVALVTGTTSGFGERFARLLSAAGAKVALTGRRVEKLKVLQSEIEVGGGDVYACPLDVTDAKSISDCVSAVEANLGAIDILVNNAGMNVQGNLVDLDVESIDTILDTNLRGPLLMAREVASRMIAQGREGRIVNIASMGALKTLPGLSTYCTTKAGLVALTKSLAREWARHEINVNAISPGYIETELNADWFRSEVGKKQVRSFPKRRLADIADLDQALLLLVNPESSSITGTNIVIDDAQSL